MQALTSPEVRLLVSKEPIDAAAECAFLYTPEAGGIDIFIGTTRRFTGERETVELVYECYTEMALREMRRLVDAAAEQWPVKRCCIVHRVGVVPLAEPSVFIGVATPHRAEAFEACRFLIDSLKREVPIWKYERYTDGSGEWVGSGMQAG
ncbi:MAG TPA: molybdenum cofactor biosynthesis protein MoaE [Rhodothermales bacterium]|nr:molybdenum cofactor biosynthesis protein MoaE [Rhodothermales bacterium]